MAVPPEVVVGGLVVVVTGAGGGAGAAVVGGEVGVGALLAGGLVGGGEVGLGDAGADPPAVPEPVPAPLLGVPPEAGTVPRWVPGVAVAAGAPPEELAPWLVVAPAPFGAAPVVDGAPADAGAVPALLGAPGAEVVPGAAVVPGVPGVLPPVVVDELVRAWPGSAPATTEASQPTATVAAIVVSEVNRRSRP